MTTLTKAEACALLHISDSTMTRRLKAGIYQCTRTGEGQYARLSFSYADIGLTEPQPEPTPAVAEVSSHDGTKLPEPTPEPETFKPRPLTRAEMDEKFARDYLSGKATDSCGNRIDQKTCSLLGTTGADYERPSASAESQSHMTAGLLGTNDTEGNAVEVPRHAFENGDGFTRGGKPLAAGFSQDAYDQAMKDWTKRGGGRSEGEQEQASRRAVDNISRSFPTAPFSRKSTVR